MVSENFICIELLLTINQKSEKNFLTLCIFDEQDIGVKRSNDGQRYYRVTVYMQTHKTALTNGRVTLVIFNSTNSKAIDINYVRPQTRAQVDIKLRAMVHCKNRWVNLKL